VPNLDLVSIVNQYDLYTKADVPITQNHQDRRVSTLTLGE
jgi:hypothetical protein